MEIDLNQEPLDSTHASVVEFDSILNELESAHGHIQDRIRHLEAVTSRTRERHRWPPVHSPIQITNFTGAGTTDNIPADGREHREVEEEIVEGMRGGKIKDAHLIAKALAVETDTCKEEGSYGNFFDCNICLDMARDPVLTCCGHLFCWPCFYQVSYAYSNVKECPVCKGEVSERGVIPIYGNGSAAGGNSQQESRETDLKIPPRPRAPRIESMRQQLIRQGASSSMIQNMRRFNNIMGGQVERVQSQRPYIATGRNNVFTPSHPVTNNNPHTHSHPISRLLMQGAASFSTLSSTLNSAERLVEDLESYTHGRNVGGGSWQLDPHIVHRDPTLSVVAAANHAQSLSQDIAAVNPEVTFVEDLESYIHGRNIEGSWQLHPHVVLRDPTFSVAAVNHSQPLSQSQGVAAATNSAAAAFNSPLSRNDGTTAAVDSANQTADHNIQIILPDHSSSHSRRRTGVSRRVSNEPRRRRRLR